MSKLRSSALAVLILVVGVLFSVVAEKKAIDTPQSWEGDLQYLAERLPRVHKNLYARISEDEFQAQVKSLKKSIGKLSPSERIVELSKLVASIGDAHTSLAYYPNEAYPLSFYWFDDGIYLIQTTSEYQEALNLRLVGINGQDLDEIISRLKGVIAHENQAMLKSMVVQYLVFPEFLVGLGIVQQPAGVPYSFITATGEELNLIVDPVPLDSEIQWTMKANYSPLYLQNRDQYYWFKYLEDEKTIYFNYNRCADMKEGESVREFSQGLLQYIEEHPVEKLVVDLRRNGGGNSRLLNYFINRIAENEQINQRGNLFVIIGRRTFSSAILNALSFREKTEAIFVGEPTGGKPNHFGEVKRLELPYSGLTVTYSTKYFEHYKDGDPASLIPDILVGFSINDFEHGRDPFLDTILQRDSFR